ncbi:MAG: glycosyltransferase [Prevotellaceae bacterium]|jgi:glycosyltransferase involved in cell wall biosynthesis|nr:glycosyltransferase [Prevotellaceae bacterium]
MPKFSIIIPVYNVEKYLRECLESVVNQTFTDFEVICVNDGSTDNSLQILQNFSNHQIIKSLNFQIINQANGGLSDARNTGIKAAQGDYIFLLDSDDYIAENTLEILVKNIDNQDFIAFNGHRFFEERQIEIADEGTSENNLTGWKYYNKYALVQRKFHFVCTVLRIYKREFLLKNKLFFKKGIYHEDNIFTPICCYYAENVKVIPDVLYFYRMRAGSISAQIKPKNIYDTIDIANCLSEFFIPKNIDKSVIYREIAGMYFSVFMPPKNLIPAREVRKLINWDFYKTVSQYNRHKRIYKLLKISVILFKIYIFIEQFFKTLTTKNTKK